MPEILYDEEGRPLGIPVSARVRSPNPESPRPREGRGTCILRSRRIERCSRGCPCRGSSSSPRNVAEGWPGYTPREEEEEDTRPTSSGVSSDESQAPPASVTTDGGVTWTWINEARRNWNLPTYAEVGQIDEQQWLLDCLNYLNSRSDDELAALINGVAAGIPLIVDDIVSGPTVEGVGTTATPEAIITGLAVERVRAMATNEFVRPVCTDECVSTVTTNTTAMLGTGIGHQHTNHEDDGDEQH